jgi:hypothetical protein
MNNENASMNCKHFTIVDLIIAAVLSAGLCLTVQLFTGAGQDIPGTGGLTRAQLAEMLYDCDRASRKPDGFCVADVNIRPSEEVAK